MFAVIDWPSNLGLRPSGVEMLPAALRREGLVEALHARDAGSVAPGSGYDPRRDPRTGVLNGPGLRHSIRALAGAIGETMGKGDTPIVLAGDCSVVLAGLLALRSRGETALLFVDGHADFDAPSASPTGEVADMDLALATGRGPEILTAFDGFTPLVREANVAAVGARDGDQAIRGTSITRLELKDIRERGITAAANEALRALRLPFWCHLDADVLDDAVMPAVDYRQRDGLTPAELTELLRAARQSGRMAGLSVAIYNPLLDPDGSGARLLVRVLTDAFCVARRE